MPWQLERAHTLISNMSMMREFLATEKWLYIDIHRVAASIGIRIRRIALIWMVSLVHGSGVKRFVNVERKWSVHIHRTNLKTIHFSDFLLIYYHYYADEPVCESLVALCLPPSNSLLIHWSIVRLIIIIIIAHILRMLKRHTTYQFCILHGVRHTCGRAEHGLYTDNRRHPVLATEICNGIYRYISFMYGVLKHAPQIPNAISGKWCWRSHTAHTAHTHTHMHIHSPERKLFISENGGDF